MANLLVVRFDSRRRAKTAVKGLERLGLVLKTAVYVTRNADVYVTCDGRNPGAGAVLAAGEKVPDAPDPATVVELYRGEAIVRFQGASGGGMVGAEVGRPLARKLNNRRRVG